MRSRSELWDLREWLRTDEAALYLSNEERRISEADLLRLALDGRIKLYVHLPDSVEAIDQTEAPGGAKRKTKGLWELQLKDAGRVEVEARYHDLCGLPYVDVGGSAGALVERDGEVRRLPADRGVPTGLAPRRASALPYGSVIVVRTEELRAFAAKLPDPVAEPAAVEKPLLSRERNTLLTIIAALAEAAEIDIKKPSKAGGQIEAMTLRLGARVSARTVEDHLKRIPDALERRAKDGYDD